MTPDELAIVVLRERRWLQGRRPKPRRVPPRAPQAADPLAAFTTREYVERLAGREFPEWGSRIICPLHDDHSRDFTVIREDATRWYCFGCGRGGDIYSFAAYLWGLDCRQDFRALRERLLWDMGCRSE